MFAAQTRYGRNPSLVVRTKTWSDPLRWQREARSKGRQDMVFTCSWSDWFHETADQWRDDAWKLVRRCPNLIFQILTKRPERVLKCLPSDWSNGYENVWLGVSVENDEYVWRADLLRMIPARIRFISAEPLLGALTSLSLEGFHWLIVGGESGPGFRPMELEWAQRLRDRAVGAGISFFFKQSAARRSESGTVLDGQTWRQYPQSF
jgi:protein gp37